MTAFNNPVAEGFFNRFVLLHAQLVEQDKTITFDPRWANGTGYLDRASRVIHLGDCELVASTDDFGRRIILVGTAAGNVVIFERYTHTDDAPEVLVSNMPQAVEALLPDSSGAWSEKTWKACFPEMYSEFASSDLVKEASWRNVGWQVAAIGKAIAARTNWVVNPNKKTKE